MVNDQKKRVSDHLLEVVVFRFLIDDLLFLVVDLDERIRDLGPRVFNLGEQVANHAIEVRQRITGVPSDDVERPNLFFAIQPAQPRPTRGAVLSEVGYNSSRSKVPDWTPRQ